MRHSIRVFILALALATGGLLLTPSTVSADGCTSSGCTTSGYYPVFQFPFFYSCFWQYTQWYDGSYNYYDSCGGGSSSLTIYWH